MLDALKSLFQAPETETDDGPDAAHMAVAVLLVEAASADDDFTDEERSSIAGALISMFGLEDAAAQVLITAAEERVSTNVELYSETKAARDALDHDGRVELMEVLWGVVYADGTLHDYEANLVRRLAGLMYVTDQESGMARKRVLDRLGLEPS